MAAVVVALVALIIAGGVGWQAHRQALARRVVPAAGGAVDQQEARLVRAVTERPADARARRDLAGYYLESRQPYEALWELVVAQDLGANDTALTLQTAAALERAGLPQAAVHRLSEARRARPGEPAVDLALAQADLAVADPAAALAALRGSPALAASAEGWLALAQAQLALGDLPAARRAAARCRATGGRGDILPGLGRLALAMGDTAEARRELAAAARERPEDEAAQYYAGLAYARSSLPADREKAIGYLKLATRVDPHKARAGVVLGRLLYEKAGQWERAVEVYRRALAMNPHCLEAEEGLARVRTALKQPGETVYHQARVCELEDRPEEALPLYRRWGELRPERWDSVLRAAECSMDMQRYLDAAREVERGLKRFPENAELLSALAQLYMRTSSRPEAARLCDRWSSLDRTSGRPEWVRGQLASNALRGNEAIRWFEAAVRKNPGMGTYHAALGEALAREPSPERLRRARSELERATALDPGMALFQYQLGLVLQQSGDLGGARRAFLRALDRDPVRLDAYRGLMAVARRLGRPGAAAFFVGLEREVRDEQREEAAARLALSAQPRAARARLALARALLSRGDLAGARNHLAVAAEQPDGAAARPALRRVQRLLRAGPGAEG